MNFYFQIFCNDSSVTHVTSALNRQILGKAAGPDGLHMEVFVRHLGFFI